MNVSVDFLLLGLLLLDVEMTHAYGTYLKMTHADVTYSLLHSECHFFIVKSQSKIWSSRSLLLRSVEKRPGRLRLEIEIE